MTPKHKALALKILWFTVMGVVIYLRAYNHLTRLESLTLFIAYTLIHVFIIQKLVMGKEQSPD